MRSVRASELMQSATFLVARSLKGRAGERLVVVADAESAEIATAIVDAATALGMHVTNARLDVLRSVSTNHSGERPHKVLPDLVRRAMLAAQASVFVASAPHQEHSMREQLLHIVTACGLRHAHMASISPFVFAKAHEVDYERVLSWGREAENRLDVNSEVLVTSPSGSELQLGLGRARWSPHLGAITAGHPVSFPAGALYAQPETLNGTFVADASLGEFFGAREGVLTDRPVRFAVRGGRITSVTCKENGLQKEIEQTLAFASNCDRIGCVALGLNAELTTATGDASLDIVLPGLHLVIGDPVGRVPNATWSARTSFAACQSASTVSAGGTSIVENGRLPFA